MKKRALLWTIPIALTAVLAGGAVAGGWVDDLIGGPTIIRSSPLQTIRDVCLAPESHRAILREGRRTAGTLVRGDAVPAIIRGNGMVDWRVVRLASIDDAPAMLAVGELGGTSFCRVYFRPVDPDAMTRRLEAETVLGAPLATPDFHGPMNEPQGWAAVGWHTGKNGQWRALHYSFDPDGVGPDATWQVIEVTRAIRARGQSFGVVVPKFAGKRETDT